MGSLSGGGHPSNDGNKEQTKRNNLPGRCVPPGEFFPEWFGFYIYGSSIFVLAIDRDIARFTHTISIYGL